MPVPEPRANPTLLGHDAAEATLIEAMRGRRMHHAWLITGPEGVGKATLAFRFARRLFAGVSKEQTLALEPGHPVFRRVAAGSHADLLTIERGYDEKRKRTRSVIQAEDVRRISAFMSLTPAEGGWRVAIVDGAEEMNTASANALLKILEEPPPRAVLLLVSSAPGRLLPTIRSRCLKLALAPLGDAAMAQLLAGYVPDLSEEARLRLATLAEGSPGRALLLAEAEGLALAALVDEVLGALPTLGPERAHSVADRLGRGEGTFSTFMDLLRAAIAAAVREAVRGRADPEQARLAALHPLDGWSAVWQGLSRLQDETERFALDRRQAIIQGLALLSEPVRGI